MLVPRSWLIGFLAAVFALAAGWLVWNFLPGRQLEKSFSRLLDAAGRRDWKTVRALMADEYRDQWGFNREEATLLASDALQQFFILEVTAENPRTTRTGREAEIAARLRVAGRGSAVAEAVKNRVNELSSDFQFAWRRKSWKPWDWKLVAVNQSEIDPDPSWLP